MARTAYMKLYIPFLENLIPAGVILDCRGDKIGPTDHEWFHEWLKKLLDLPYNCKIKRVSTSHFFLINCVGISLECDDFVEVDEGCIMPEVMAIYHQDSHLKFCHWAGDYALRAEYNESNCSICNKIEDDERTIKAFKELAAKEMTADEAAEKAKESVSIRFREFL